MDTLKLFRYYWHNKDTGHVGDSIAGFRSFSAAQEQMKHWSVGGWRYWVQPQVTITIPHSVLESDDVHYVRQGSHGPVVTAACYHPRDLDRWRYVFEKHDCEFDDRRLAPPVPEAKQIDLGQLYLVSGRVWSDGDDTAYAVEAPDRDTAQKLFSDQLREESGVPKDTPVIIVSNKPLARVIEQRFRSSVDAEVGPSVDRERSVTKDVMGVAHRSTLETASTGAPAIEYEVNEIHVARYRVEKADLSEEEWRGFLRLKTDDQRAAYLGEMGITADYVEDSLEYSREAEETRRNFCIVGEHVVPSHQADDGIDDQKHYKVRRSVSGGVTGSRTAYVKENGKEIVWTNREEAATYARELNAQRMSPGVRHHAQVEEFEGPAPLKSEDLDPHGERNGPSH